VDYIKPLHPAKAESTEPYFSGHPQERVQAAAARIHIQQRHLRIG